MERTPTRYAKWITLVLAIATPTLANAEAPSEASDMNAERHAQATNAYEQGLSAFERGNLAVALSEFSKSYEIDSDFHVLYNIGATLQRLRRHGDAIRAFERYLNDGSANIPSARFDEVVQRIRFLRDRTATLTIVVDEPDAHVFLDGQNLDERARRDLLIDIGAHEVRVLKSNFETIVRTVTLTKGDSSVVTIHLAAGKRVLAPTSQAGSERSWATTPMWISWALTGVGAATTFVLHKQQGRLQDEVNHLDTNDPQYASQADLLIDQKHSWRTGTAIVGVFTAAAGIASLVFTGIHVFHKVDESRSEVSRGVTLDGTGVSGRF